MVILLKVKLPCKLVLYLVSGMTVFVVLSSVHVFFKYDYEYCNTTYVENTMYNNNVSQDSVFTIGHFRAKNASAF